MFYNLLLWYLESTYALSLDSIEVKNNAKKNKNVYCLAAETLLCFTHMDDSMDSFRSVMKWQNFSKSS